jgi:hypothetical protein
MAFCKAGFERNESNLGEDGENEPYGAWAKDRYLDDGEQIA